MCLAPGLFDRFLRTTSAELGLLGERLVARHLRRRGWRVLGMRVRTPWGEVDVVAARGAELLCVEVKAGRVSDRARAFRPSERFRWRSRGRQRRSAEHLARELGRGLVPRMALYEVLLPAAGARSKRRPILVDVRARAGDGEPPPGRS